MSDHQSSPDDVLGLMRAIRGAGPGVIVEVALRSKENDGAEWATVRVAGLPAVEYRNIGDYPNCEHELNDSLCVNRYTDGDLAAALRTALDMVITRCAQPVSA